MPEKNAKDNSKEAPSSLNIKNFTARIHTSYSFCSDPAKVRLAIAELWEEKKEKVGKNFSIDAVWSKTEFGAYFSD